MLDRIAHLFQSAPSLLTVAAALCFIVGVDSLTAVFACLAFIQQFVLRLQVKDMSALDRHYMERKPIPEAPRQRISDRYRTWEHFVWNTHFLVAFVFVARPAG